MAEYDEDLIDFTQSSPVADRGNPAVLFNYIFLEER